MMLRQPMQSARLIMSSKAFFLSQLRLVPKGLGKGSTMFEGVELQKITSIRLQLFHNKKIQVLTTINKKCYNNYTRDTQDTNRQD
jgi:hypothetical protein